MLEKIAHYPNSLKTPISRIWHNPLKGQLDLFQEGPALCRLPETAAIKRGDLLPDKPRWLNSIVGPCLFMVIMPLDLRASFDQIKAGHFSTAFSDHEIDVFLSRSNNPPEASRVWVAGLAQRTNHNTLRGTTERLVERINKFGISIDLRWKSHDRPELYDTKRSQIISDIGYGLLTEEECTGRMLSFGTTADHSVMISSLFSYAGSPPIPLRTHFFMPETGLLTKKFA